jgi:DNA-binding CsgD family transcriptional regulator
MMDEKFHRLVSSIEQASVRSETQQILKLVCENCGISHVAYLGLHVQASIGTEPIVCVTYPDTWISHYVAQNYLAVDPVIHQSLLSVLPTDWDTFPLHGKKIRSLFGEAKEFGIGPRGMTFPIRGRSGELALFSISCNHTPKDWDDFKRTNLPQMQMLAFYIHKSICSGAEAKYAVAVKLSPREAECLKWAAKGKSFEDIGDILGLSARTVRFYLDLARHKLNCLNVTHAVARAISLDLISPPE